MTAIADTAWHVWLWTPAGKRVLTAIIEEDAEVVSRLKLMAAELNLHAEISPVAPIKDQDSPSNPPPLKIPENWTKPKR